MRASFFDELTKIAAKDRVEEAKNKAMRGAVSVRPWAQSAGKVAIPAAVAANFLHPGEGSAKRKFVAAMGLLGAGAGVADRAIRRWADKHPRGQVARELKSQTKLGALAGDLRMNGIGGVKRPPFPTEGSKSQAFKQFRASTNPGKFTTQTQPKHLVRPGPSIGQVAPIPR